MSKNLNCAQCGKLMAVLRDAKIRHGIVVFCDKCCPKSAKETSDEFSDVVDFLMGFGRAK